VIREFSQQDTAHRDDEPTALHSRHVLCAPVTMAIDHPEQSLSPFSLWHWISAQELLTFASSDQGPVAVEMPAA
jgi:hypothetical protein